MLSRDLAEGGELRSLRPVKWAHRRGGKPAACFWREGTAWKRKREEGRPSGFFELVERGKEGGGGTSRRLASGGEGPDPRSSRARGG
jgi:hypothetical protein